LKLEAPKHREQRQTVFWNLILGLILVLAAGCPGLLNNDREVCRAFPVEEDERQDQLHPIAHGGLNRTYLVHFPEGRSREDELPAVLVFHGGGSRPEAVRAASRMNAVADRNGFVAIYPAGTGPSFPCLAGPMPILTWNAGNCCGNAVENDVDDVGFVGSLLDSAAREYPIDASRVYATGISNGAMMAYRLAVELSDRVAAIGPVAGSMMVDGPPPPRPVPVVHFHGRMDRYAPFLGGQGINAATNPVVHRSIPDTIAWWVDANRCADQPDTQITGDFIRQTYRPLELGEGGPVVLYELPEGGHTWPGGVDIALGVDSGGLVEDVDASSLMWEFFDQFTIPPG
jgi:polyhydroxybutyrate depolymerase